MLLNEVYGRIGAPARSNGSRSPIVWRGTSGSLGNSFWRVGNYINACRIQYRGVPFSNFETVEEVVPPEVDFGVLQRPFLVLDFRAIEVAFRALAI